MGSGASSCCNFSRKGSFQPSKQSKGSFRSVSSEGHYDGKVELAEDTNFMSSNDIEKQPLLSYAEAAALRPSSPETMWDIVEKTCIQDNSGTLDSVQNRRGWKTIRLFVSSTFRDFHAEREVLVKEVFPDLRLWCEERKLHLVECDLRWGVPKDSTTEETVRICLEEIDRCYKDNVMPYFLNLTCGRSGWVPDFGDLTDNLAVLYGWVYGLSLTEMEIVHGAFRQCNPNALFLIRDDKFCDELPGEVKDAFVDPKNQRKPAILKDVLKGKFPAQNIAHYKVECDPKSLNLVAETKDERELKFKGLDSDSVFCKTVFNFFRDRIAHQYPLDPTPEDPLEAQRKAHESFVDTRSQVVLGRDKIIADIENYIETDTTQAPLLLVGSAGSGKSAIMARIASNALIKGANNKLRCPNPKEGWKVFFHFVGATPGSTDLAFFLQRLTRELGYSKTDVASDLDSLIQMTNSLLSNANTKPAILVIDAINQLDEDKIHFLPRWLPDVLSPNVRVIMSMIDQTECHRMVRAYKSGPKEILCGELDYNSRQAIVENILRFYSKRLDEHQMELLLKKEGSANPLWLTLACEELRVFGHFDEMDEKIASLKDDLISLEEQLLMRFEKENGGPVVIATMCLLETSRHGLLETELLQMLADETTLVPPKYNEEGMLTAEKTDELEAPRGLDMSDGDAVASKLQNQVDETYAVKKEDAEEGEREKKKSSKKKTKKFLSAAKWALVYRALKPLLRPCGDLGEGRFDFYHRSISKAVRKRYFSGSDGYVKHQYAFWHGRNAEFFESCDDYDRKSEELPYHLEQLLDHNRLTRCLLDWEIFQRLYSEVFSIDLLSSWQKAGGYAAASLLYKESLDVLKTAEVPLEEYAERMQMVINFLIQAGQYDESYNLLNELIKIEENELGARTDKMADIYHLMAKTKSEIVKNTNFITMDQLQDDKEIVEIARKSLSYRIQLQGEEHEHKKASLGIIVTHHLAIVADLESKNGAKHRAECFKMIDEAVAIFKKLGDLGHLADALMTKTFINPRQKQYFKEKEQMLMEAFELCTKAYGTKHMLVLRLYLNIGILYEDNGDYQKAYDYFVKWNKVCMEVLGPAHPKAKRSTDTLNEPMYKRIREQRERQAAGTA